MPEPGLQLAPPSDSNRLVPKLVIAGVVMVVIGVAVFLLNPRKTAEITVQQTQIFAPHTQFEETKSNSHIIGTAPETEDDVYLVATLKIEDKLRLPIFLTNTSAAMITKDGTKIEATVISPTDLPRLEETFPQVLPLVSPPAAPSLQFQDAIAPGASRIGTVVLLFPQVSEKDWKARQSATLTLHLAHDAAPISVALP